MPSLTGVQAMDELRQKGLRFHLWLVSTANSGTEDYTKRGAMAFVNKVDIGHDLVMLSSRLLRAGLCSRSAEERRSNPLRWA